jgi:hypothetical protein
MILGFIALLCMVTYKTWNKNAPVNVKNLRIFLLANNVSKYRQSTVHAMEDGLLFFSNYMIYQRHS